MDRFEKECLITEWKQRKESNSIAIGGMISAGKSTIVEKLAKKHNFKPIYELDENKNSLMYILLDRMYQREQIAQSVCQLQFLLSRYENYKNGIMNYSKDYTIIYDRTIFEDRLFAFHNMLDEPSIFSYYEKIWRDKVSELIYNVGIPKLYIILDIDWETFKKRLFGRGREIEVDNYEKNKEYFKLLNKTYTKYLINICCAYCIPYTIVNANLELPEKLEIIDKKLRELKIIN